MSGQMENVIFIALWILEIGTFLYIVVWPVFGGRDVEDAGLWTFFALMVWIVQLVYLVYRMFGCSAVGCGEARSIVEIMVLVAINISLLAFLKHLAVHR